MGVGLFFNTDFAGLWGHDNPQDPICAKSRTVFLVTVSNCTPLLVSKQQTEIYLPTINSECVALHHYVRDLLPWRSVIKEVINNLGMGSK